MQLPVTKSLGGRTRTMPGDVAWHPIDRSSRQMATALTQDRSNDRPFVSGLGSFQTTSVPPRILTVASTSPATKKARWCYFNLGVFIRALGLAGGACGVLPAQVTFNSAVVRLTMIRVRLPPPVGTRF